MVSVLMSCGAQVHGDISRRTEQCNDATWAIEKSVYTIDAILNALLLVTSTSTSNF